MLAPISIKGLARSFTSSIRRESLILACLANEVSDASLPTNTCFTRSLTHLVPIRAPRPVLEVPFTCHLFGFPLVRISDQFEYQGDLCRKWMFARCISKQSLELKTENDVVRFSVSKRHNGIDSSPEEKVKSKSKRVKMSKRAKVNQLKLYRLMARKKMNSPNPEVRIRYKLEKAKRKEEWLIEKLRKFEIPKAPAEVYDPEILTEEEKHYLKRTGEKKKHYVPVGRRGVFGGVVLNMHLHWKKHETVKVICRPCKPGQLPEYAEELARLSKGIVIDIKYNSTIIFYRGKNYVQPEVMSPPNTLSKEKALAKYKYLQSLEHTSQFIEKLERELEDYHNHLARFNQTKHNNAIANQPSLG